jgi:hypothetical protein
MNNQAVHALLDTLNWKSLKHVKQHVQAQFSAMSETQIDTILKERQHDRRRNENKHLSKYYIKIFSSRPKSWFCDIFDNTAAGNPRYWMLFINTNTRFGRAYQLNGRSVNDVQPVFQQFINDEHPVKITSDEEAAFVSNQICDFLEANHVSQHIVTQANHSSLGIIDRFIRTLRDMNTPRGDSINQSKHQEFKTITPAKMTHLLNLYNTTEHTQIKMSPQDMQTDPNKEKEYIFKMMEKKDKQSNRVPDMQLNIGDLVRVRLPRRDFTSKKRSSYSVEYFRISGLDGFQYTLMANDGDTMTLPRWRLLPVINPTHYKYADHVADLYNQGNGFAVIHTIYAYNPATHHFDVDQQMPGGQLQPQYITIHAMRGNFPQNVTRLIADYGPGGRKRNYRGRNG